MILLLSFFSVLCSCESEYQQQMAKARELVRQEVKVRESMNGQFTARSVKVLSQLKRSIDFSAHLSGNETVFLTELNGFKNDLVQETTLDNILISKYP